MECLIIGLKREYLKSLSLSHVITMYAAFFIMIELIIVRYIINHDNCGNDFNKTITWTITQAKL